MNAVLEPSPVQGARRTIALQVAIAATALGWLLLAPPAQGQIILVPLTTDAARALPAVAIHGDIRLIGSGPIPGSLLVEGRSADFSGFLIHHATLALATPFGGCGAGGVS
jgi:hypothetical protein